MVKSLWKKFWGIIPLKGKNSLIKNFLVVASISLLSSLISFYKETLVASFFGLSRIMDTYLIAVLIPSMIQNIFVEALKKLFIPNYVTEMKTSGRTGSFQTFVLISISVLIIILTILAFIFTEFFLEIVFAGHDENFYKLVRKQFYIAIPCLFFWGYTSFMGGILEMENRFSASTISQFITPIAIIFSLLFLEPYFPDLVLVIGLTLGSMLTFFYFIIINLKYRTIKFKKLIVNNNMMMMVKQYPPKVTSGLLTGINPFVDQFFAAQLVVGSITAISYGLKIPGFVVSILMMALGTVLLPHFSKSINENLKEAYKELSRF